MITTGKPGFSATRKTEVVNVLNGETCADLADFPFFNWGAVGANFHGTLVVCGGAGVWSPMVMKYEKMLSTESNYRTCYKYTNAGWQKFASMKERRGWAAGVMHKDKFHVFGGQADFSDAPNSKTTELISIDGVVEYGPDLPEAIRLHEITSVNSTVSILCGGKTNTDSSSPLTWYFNHETNIFSAGPSLLEGRRYFGSATCVDKVTKAKIPMVTAGYNRNTGRLRSTELLLNGMWQSGTIWCKKINHVLILYRAITCS